MTVADLCCDHCGGGLALPPGFGADSPAQQSVRFSYHPGDPHLRDNSGLLCLVCWRALSAGWGEPVVDRCAACAAEVSRFTSLHVKSSEQEGTCQLCREDAVTFLNQLRTVEPKLDRDAFRFPPPEPAG